MIFFTFDMHLSIYGLKQIQFQTAVVAVNMYSISQMLHVDHQFLLCLLKELWYILLVDHWMQATIIPTE